MFATLPLAVPSLRKILSNSRRSWQALPDPVGVDLEWAIFGSSLFFIYSHNLYHFFHPLHRLSSPNFTSDSLCLGCGVSPPDVQS
jgi:hypothetical protein